MKYISIGAVVTEGTEYLLDVCRGSNTFHLSGEQAAVWLKGRFGFAIVSKPSEVRELEHLVKLGLAIQSGGSAPEEYRTLAQCTLVPADRKLPYWGVSGVERTVLQWLREAGLVLSMAELTFLIDRNIAPVSDLLGSENTQNLVERIYTRETIYDNILENQMEHVGKRDDTVKAVLNLLRKKRIVLL